MKKSPTLPALLCFFFAPFGANILAQSVTLETHSTGYNWLIGFEAAPAPIGNGNVLYVFQKDGLIRLCLPDGTLEPTPFLDLSAQVNNSFNNEQGLVGLAFHPDYEANGFFFVFYNETGTGDCTISRFSRSENNPAVADPNSETVLLTWPHPLANHIGGCMQFGADGYLYIASGDGGGAGDPNGNGQNLNTYLGKLLRIDVDNGGEYAVPPDNPFVDTPDALPEIFAYGLRNPWRFSFDRVTGDLWLGDVGQDEREEINRIPAGSAGGQNFGWSCMEGTLVFNGDECGGEPLTPPIYEYENSLSSGNCSVTGGVVYRGSRYADLFGKYLFTDFCSGRIWALTPNDGEVESVVEMGDFNNNDFTGLNASPNGEIFVTGFFSNEIFRLKSTDCTPVAWIPGPSSISLGSGPATLEAYRTDDGFGYQWMRDGEVLSGETDFSLNTSEPGDYTVIVTEFGGSCTNTSNVVTVNSMPDEPIVLGLSETCEGADLWYEIESISGAEYQWEVAGGTLIVGQGTNTVKIFWSQAGVGELTVTVTLANGTILNGQRSVIVAANDLSLEAETPEAICPDEDNGFIDLTVNGTGDDFEFLWNTDDVTEDISNLPSGEYEVTVTSDLGCQASESFLLSEAPLPEYEINISPENCLGPGSVFINASSPPCGAWEVSALPVVAAGPWAITATDCFGCQYSLMGEVPDEVHTIEVAGVQLVNPVDGQSNGSIGLEFAGGTAPYSVYWSNGSTDNPLTDIPAGTYTATITDAEGCTLEYTAILSEVILNTGEEFSLAQNITVFPNPTTGAFTLEFDLPQAEDMIVNLVDASGRWLKNLLPEKRMTAGKRILTFDLSGFPTGIYFVEIKIGEAVFAEKIVKK